MNKKTKLALSIVSGIAIIGTLIAMVADQAVGSCCGSRESANIEPWWWIALVVEIVVLVYVLTRKSR
jgi:predicted CDP-diglyceride synthetase/phosphatidate cytidylyltransferase